MKIFSAEQIRRWDEATQTEQRITSHELMERAAFTCVNWLIENNHLNRNIQIFCGTGNNGGDGFAMARILWHAGAKVFVHALPGNPSELNLENRRLLESLVQINLLEKDSALPILDPSDLVIEALFGTGLKRKPEGPTAKLIEYLNHSGCTIISVDMPGGLLTDEAQDHTAITASHTLTFQHYKYSFFFPNSEKNTGKIHLMDIGLSRHFATDEKAAFELLEPGQVGKMIKPRDNFSHKGDYGHAALIAGSRGMMGAAVLAAKGCLYAGAGKLTCYVPAVGYPIIQTTVPAAMAVISGKNKIRSIALQSGHAAIGAGPGIGDHVEVIRWIEKLCTQKIPLILDADALNAIAKNKGLLEKLPKGTIITPHHGEFKRLFGTVSDPISFAVDAAKKYGIYIILKGKFSCIATPGGQGYFNPTGNPGMARGGMGDLLTGMLTGLRAQGYSPLNACLLGVYWHGLSADIAVKLLSQQTLQPEDVLQHMAAAWNEMEKSLRQNSI